MIITERLQLRHFDGCDREIQEMLKNWISDPEVQHEYGEPVYDSFSSVQDLMEKYISEQYRWAIYEKKSGECIGQIALCRVWNDVNTAEIEYCIGSGFQGNRYAGEALQAVIEHVFTNTDIMKLEAYQRKANPRSGNVLKKSYMHPADTVERFRRQGLFPKDELCYCITAAEWRRK